MAILLIVSNELNDYDTFLLALNQDDVDIAGRISVLIIRKSDIQLSDAPLA